MKTKMIGTIQISDYSGSLESPYNADGAFSKSYNEQLTDGTGSGKAQVVFADQRTLGASANEELDLSGGVTDQFGQTITFTKIKAVQIIPSSDNSEALVVGGAASNTFVGWFADASDKENVPASGLSLHCHKTDGWTVTAATGDLLKIEAGASGATYDIVIVGEGSAA